ncbi:MAG: 5'-methylthioadenosine/S-adenosylhomocysteine nucleosidase, partial [Pseudomonadota bacterium]
RRGVKSIQFASNPRGACALLNTHIKSLFVVAALLSASCAPEEAAAPRGGETSKGGPARIALATPIWTEFDAHLAHMTGTEERTINGVPFVLGEMEGAPVLLIKTGVSIVNAAATIQLALDAFEISEIVISGVAGGVDPNLSVGDIVVPARWGKFDEMVFLRRTEAGTPTTTPWGEALSFEPFEFMAPRGVYRPDTKDGSTDRQFWFEADADLMAAAEAAARKVTLAKCDAAKNCLREAPEAVLGGSGVTGSVFVDNAEFRDYLYTNFEAQASDMETAAVGAVAALNGVPFIAFRSLSDLAGGGPGANEFPVFKNVAADNAAAFAAAYMAERASALGAEAQ